VEVQVRAQARLADGLAAVATDGENQYEHSRALRSSRRGKNFTGARGMATTKSRPSPRAVRVTGLPTSPRIHPAASVSCAGETRAPSIIVI
jgi:hypothetical protein